MTSMFLRMTNRAFAVVSLTVLFSVATQAADLAPPASDWEVQTGLRYWYSTGKAKKDLYDPFVTSQLNSRLTYSGLKAHTGEIFARADHKPTGIFLKGLAGIGESNKGHLQDEDFPPGITPYSSTISNQDNADIGYARIDLGYTFLDTRGSGAMGMRFGGFVGYQYYHQYLNAYGCRQTATNPLICVPTIPRSVLGISQDNDWHSLRLGLVADFYFADKLRLTVDAAYARSKLDGKDHHWLRPAINPLREKGGGSDGFQVEGVISYKFYKNISLGIGGRYWYYGKANAKAHWEDHFPGVPPAPLDWKTKRYGVFFQVDAEF